MNSVAGTDTSGGSTGGGGITDFIIDLILQPGSSLKLVSLHQHYTVYYLLILFYWFTYHQDVLLIMSLVL
jgi:hypothetical protein